MIRLRQLFLCVCVGLWAGLIIGFVTEYYTSNAYSPVQDIADSCRNGAATNVIFGLALGYKSVIIPMQEFARQGASELTNSGQQAPSRIPEFVLTSVGSFSFLRTPNWMIPATVLR